MATTVEKVSLLVPTLKEVASIFEEALKKNFAEANVTVVDCPDLTVEPFGLAAVGLCGKPRMADVGGVRYLLPLPKKDKVYSLDELAKQVELPNAFIIGAGAGPFSHVGVNSELMANVVTGGGGCNESRVAKINNAGGDELLQLPATELSCSLMLNLFACEGRSGQVLFVKAKTRTGKANFVSCMREALAKYYGDKPVGIGGAFVLAKGKVMCHVMPEFSTVPINSDEDTNKWLRFFDFAAPMVFLSTFVSADPGLDLRVEHTHGYGSEHGGHYHYDTTPDNVAYEGYFNVAEFLYRVDRPS